MKKRSFKRIIAIVLVLCMMLPSFTAFDFSWLGNFALPDIKLPEIKLPSFSVMVNAANHTPVDGITVSVSGSSSDSMSNGSVTVTAKGSGGLFGLGASAKTATITITNSGDKQANISFSWTAT